jgi:hypothetical protein
MRNLAVVFVLAVAGFGAFEIGGAVAQSTTIVPVDIQSIQDARAVLKNATGRYCPSLFCTFSGYDIGAIDLIDNGQTIVLIHDDGTRGDTLPVRSLNPKDMGLGVVGFTADFEPQLVTTVVEAQRLTAALNTIKQASPAMLSSNPAQTQTASIPSGLMTASPAPPTPAPAITPLPASAPAVAPAPLSATAANAPLPVSPGYGGKRLAIKVVSQCPGDPDPMGVANMSFYSDCDQDELDKVRGWIAASLSAKSMFGQIGDNNPDLVLTVTLTKDMDDRSGALTDFSTGAFEFEANYQLADGAGYPLQSGTVSHQAPDDEDGAAAEQQFADKIATSVAASSGMSGQPISATAPPELTPTTTGTSLQDTHSKPATAPTQPDNN